VIKQPSIHNIHPKTWFVNFITFSRIAVLFFTVHFNHPMFLLFAISWAAFSDFLDGFLSRRLNCVTKFGRQFDQVADKVVTVYFFLLLYFNQEIHLWFIILFFAREMVILPGRALGLFSKDSNVLGKLKTILVYFFIIVIYLNMNFAFVAQEVFSAFKNMVQFTIIMVSLVSLYQSLLFPKKKYITHSTALMFGSGLYSSFLVKKMPGTITSLVFMAVFYLWKDIAFDIKLSIFAVALIAHFVLYKSFARWANEDDPSNYTLDEVLALMCFWLMPFNAGVIWILGFVLFRFYDILKPLGIRNLEKASALSPAMKVLADDLLAMVYTIISIYLFEKAFVF